MRRKRLPSKKAGDFVMFFFAIVTISHLFTNSYFNTLATERIFIFAFEKADTCNKEFMIQSSSVEDWIMFKSAFQILFLCSFLMPILANSLFKIEYKKTDEPMITLGLVLFSVCLFGMVFLELSTNINSCTQFRTTSLGQYENMPPNRYAIIYLGIYFAVFSASLTINLARIFGTPTLANRPKIDT